MAGTLGMPGRCCSFLTGLDRKVVRIRVPGTLTRGVLVRVGTWGLLAGRNGGHGSLLAADPLATEIGDPP